MYLSQLAILACLLIATTVSLPTQNNNELTKSVTTASKTFRIISYEKRTWYGALNACHVAGMELVSIHSKEEDDAFIDFIKETGLEQYWWTSGSDLDVDGEYVWAANGRPFSYFNWAAGVSNDTDHNCVILTPTGYNDFTCEKSFQFVCQE